ncbi:MAG: hypothetical protein ACRDV7_09835 [Acidimicrobiia bacterium]
MLLAGTAFVSGLTVVALVLIAAAITDRSAGDFTRDVRTLCLEAGARLPFYAGWVSQLNIMVWSVAAALAGAVAYLEADRRLWMLTFATLLTILALDDALTLHEGGPHRVIPEPIFYVAYAVFAVLLLAIANDGIDDHAVLFLIGGLCLAGSIAVDTVVEHRYLVEDSFKLVGALLWLAIPLLGLAQLKRQMPIRDETLSMWAAMKRSATRRREAAVSPVSRPQGSRGEGPTEADPSRSSPGPSGR